MEERRIRCNNEGRWSLGYVDGTEESYIGGKVKGDRGLGI
jgi:hypothetical protein